MTAMNADTDYVHTAVINYEPTYAVLDDIASRWQGDGEEPIAAYRDELQGAVEANFAVMGLHPSDLTDDVDYVDIIRFEAGV